MRAKNSLVVILLVLKIKGGEEAELCSVYNQLIAKGCYNDVTVGFKWSYYWIQVEYYIKQILASQQLMR